MPMPPLPDGLTEADLLTCQRVLAALAARPELCDAEAGLGRVREHAGRLMRACRKLDRRDRSARDREVLDLRTGIRAGARPPAPFTLSAARDCYVCQRPFTQVHFFYDSLCPECAELNYRKRGQSVDLAGRVALVTGGRVKIGRQVALSLLRWGATVLVTTRFPRDAARRFAAEPDFADWAGRLRVFGLDLRPLREVERFADGLCRGLDRLDVLVNNAAQTVRRPPAYYRDLIAAESQALPAPAERLLADVTGASPALLSGVPLLSDDGGHAAELFALGGGEPRDLRERTSWHLELHEVELPELVEAHAVNCLAPFVLMRSLDPLWRRLPGTRKFVVNVSSVEGNFASDSGKTGRHPHTNMAKAAMNMITRTAAGPYARRGVYVNSVDPGWVSNEAPRPRAEAMARAGFREPLDFHDAAARVLDPVYAGLGGGEPAWGQLFKDYRAVAW